MSVYYLQKKKKKMKKVETCVYVELKNIRLLF